MNYIKLINAFYDRLETNSLSTSAIALWHALVHISNKTGWKREFSVAASVLSVKTGLSERTIANARNELKVKGYIEFRSRGGNRSAVYKLVDLSEINSGNLSDNETLSEINSDTFSDTLSYSLSDSVSDNLSVLNKQNETKQNETNISAAANTRANCFETYTVCFGGSMSPFQIEEIRSFMEDGITEEVICRAFEKAAEVGAKYSYARSILNRWAKKGVRTMADVEREEEEFRKKRKSHNQSGRPVRKEAIPEWFDQWQPVETQDTKIENFEEEKRKLEAELKSMSWR